jgi:hypothetical protein
MEVFMHPAAYDFVEYLKEATETDYGDFKRRTDLHLLRLMEAGGLTAAEVAEANTLRREMLWGHVEDSSLDQMKSEFLHWAEKLH